MPTTFNRNIAISTLIVVMGPVMLLPDMVPAAARTAVVTILSLIALGTGVAMLTAWRGILPALALFVIATIGSWAMMPSHDVLAQRHFAGIAFGVLTMAFVATWITDRNRLWIAASAFALASIAILIVGLFSAASHFNSTKFVTWVNLLPPQTLASLMRFKLGLPGLEAGGQVNPNAVAGTAMLLTPACVGLTAAALRSGGRRGALAVGLVASFVGLAVLAITLSRTAWIGAVVTLLILGLRWGRGRRWVLLAIAVIIVAAAIGIFQWRAAGTTMFDRDLRGSALARTRILREGLTQVRRSPWLGIGINQFHEVPGDAGVAGDTHVAHAHNTFVQVALDIGVPGLCGYLALLVWLLWAADRAARVNGPPGWIAGGAGLSLVGVHVFGMADAIALGAKVGLFQWICAGLILACSRLPPVLPQAFENAHS